MADRAQRQELSHGYRPQGRSDAAHGAVAVRRRAAATMAGGVTNSRDVRSGPPRGLAAGGAAPHGERRAAG